MSMFDNLKAKAEEAMAEHPEKVEEFSDLGIEKAGDALDAATKGKFADQVDTAQQKADEAIGD